MTTTHHTPHATGAPLTSAGVNAPLAELDAAISATSSVTINVKAHGALGDGATDDSVAIETASLALATAGGGVLYFPAGTYIVSFADIPGYTGYKAGVVLRSGCTLAGDGMGATTIKLAANQASYGSAGIVRNADWGGGDERLTIKDITIDGNGANQTTLYQGIDWELARSIRHERVRVINVRGTHDYPPGETFHFNAHSSTEVFYSDCEAQATAGTQGSGFGSNICTNVVRVNCISHGMSAGMGFADWTSRNVTMSNCVAQRNGSNGFNAEYCDGYVLSGCIAGGRAANGASNYPWGSDTVLGNTGSGIVINATTQAVLEGCLSFYNTNNGLAIVTSGGVNSEVQVIGGRFSNNAQAGIYIGDAACARLTSVSLSVIMGNNTRDMSLQPTIGYVSDATSSLAAPAVPASTVALTNDFPFDVTVYLYGGTVTVVSIDGATTGLTAGTFRVGPGRSITLTYSSAPTWVWSRR